MPAMMSYNGWPVKKFDLGSTCSLSICILTFILEKTLSIIAFERIQILQVKIIKNKTLMLFYCLFLFQSSSWHSLLTQVNHKLFVRWREAAAAQARGLFCPKTHSIRPQTLLQVMTVKLPFCVIYPLKSLNDCFSF